MSTTVNWSNEEVMDALNEVVIFLGTDRPPVIGYKVGQIRLALNPMTKGIGDAAVKLVEDYRKVIDGHKIPHVQDGRQVPIELWCTNPKEYQEKDKALMEVRQDITFGVRLSFDELRMLPSLRGNFWVALNDLIDPPKEEVPKQPAV